MSKLKVCHLMNGLGTAYLGFKNIDKNLSFEHTLIQNFESDSKIQHAASIYTANNGTENFINEDILNIDTIPECDIITMLLSNCQFEDEDNVFNNITDKISQMEAKPKILVMECPEKLLTQPQDHRGYLMYTVLMALKNLNYAAEWRVINPADYGMPQKRKRLYIIAYATDLLSGRYNNVFDWILYDSILTKAFPCKISEEMIYSSYDYDSIDIEDFSSSTREKTFENTGFINNDGLFTCRTIPFYNGKFKTLDDIIVDDENYEKYITEDLYIEEDKINLWISKKGRKQLDRMNKITGEQYIYTEGAMLFPDPLNRASRSIMPSEGSKAPSRFTHVIEDPVNGRLRRLAPVEIERLFGLPDNYTQGLPGSVRASILGKSSIVTIMEKIATQIISMIGDSTLDIRDELKFVEHIFYKLLYNNNLDTKEILRGYQIIQNLEEKINGKELL